MSIKRLKVIYSSFFSLLFFVAVLPVTVHAAGVGFWSTQGGKIIDSQGNTVIIRGVNMGGLINRPIAENNFDGVFETGWRDILTGIKNSGFNTIRLPITSDNLRQDCIIKGSAKNKDVRGITCLELVDKYIEYSGEIGLRIILDMHRIKNESTTEDEFWYGSGLTEEKWVDNWKMLARRYRNNPTVVGADIKNEPHGRACWGKTACTAQHGRYIAAYDWKRAAERAGNAILTVHPDWLIFIEGYRWGQELKGFDADLVKLNKPNKVVYSAHVYAVGTFGNSGAYPMNGLTESGWKKTFEDNFGFLVTQNIAPILIGETNIKFPNQLDWFKSVLRYAQNKGISWTIWAWHKSPLGGQGQGIDRIIEDNYIELSPDKQALFSPYFFPLDPNSITPPNTPTPTNGAVTGTPGPTATPAPKKADADGNGVVDEQDYNILKTNYLLGQRVDPNDATKGNFNSDRVVNGLDYLIWLRQYGK